MLTGLRGVGKTVLLGELRSTAVRTGWGAGEIEARPEADLRRPPSAALHRAVRDLVVRHPDGDRVAEVLGVLKAFALRSAPADAELRDRWQSGIDVPVRSGRAASGDVEIDLVELFTGVATLDADLGTGIAVLVDEMQDLRPDDVSALCAACHELSRSRAPLVVARAGLPHLPAVLSASKSYSERLFRCSGIGPLDREDADFALPAPAEREDAAFDTEALLRLALRARHPRRARVPARHGRAHRRPRRARADLGHRRAPGPTGVVAVPGAGRPMKEGLVFSAQRGQIAFTVPRFGRYLLAHA